MKYFVVSDIHGFYQELIDALAKRGFDESNPDHTLVVNGDCFDRGEDAVAVYNYLTTLKRVILIKGNHEYLLEKCLEKTFPDSYDFSNGTVDTILQFVGMTRDEFDAVNPSYILDDEEMYRKWRHICFKCKETDAYKWLTDKKNWLDYLEIRNFIITHSFIPLINRDGLPYYYIDNRKFEYDPDWRKIPHGDDRWEEASWGCPYKLFDAGYFNKEAEKGKVLVCGHWHSEDFNKHYDKDPGNFAIYVGKNLIAIDGCTVVSSQVNVFLIED